MWDGLGPIPGLLNQNIKGSGPGQVYLLKSTEMILIHSRVWKPQITFTISRNALFWGQIICTFSVTRLTFWGKKTTNSASKSKGGRHVPCWHPAISSTSDLMSQFLFWGSIFLQASLLRQNSCEIAWWEIGKAFFSSEKCIYIFLSFVFLKFLQHFIFLKKYIKYKNQKMELTVSVVWPLKLFAKYLLPD